MAVPWAQPGWLEEASAWITRRLEEAGHAPVTGIETVRSWSISCVLRASTPGGDFYFKAVPPLFSSEAEITRALARIFPEEVPAPLAVDRQRDWMLLPDLGPHNLNDEEASVEEWCSVVRLHARVQRESVGRVEELLAAGCASRPLLEMPADLGHALADRVFMAHLDRGTALELEAAAPLLKERCERLAAYRVPETLVHGDLNGGNIVRLGGRHLVFDWTDAAVSHPFLDLSVILFWHIPPERRDDQERVIASYLREWEAYEPAKGLREALELSRPLSCLYQVISHRHILSALDKPDQSEILSGAVPMWTRRLLGAL